MTTTIEAGGGANGDVKKEAPAVLNEADINLEGQEYGPMEGTVYRAFMQGVFIEFDNSANGGEKELAMFYPGKMYFNGSNNVFNLMKTERMLQTLFPHGKKVNFMVRQLCKVPEFVFVYNGSQYVLLEKGTGAKRTDGDKRLVKQAEQQESKSVKYYAHLVWVGEMKLNKLRDNLKKNVHFQHEEECSIQLIQEVQQRFFSIKEADEKKPIEIQDEKWFLVSQMGDKARNAIKFPQEADKSRVRGVVREIHRPHGGIIDTGRGSGGLLYFNRSRVLLDGFRIGVMDTLEDCISVGDVVKVDVFKNAGANGEAAMENCPANNIALWVYKGEVTDPPALCKESGTTYTNSHKIKIIEFYSDQEGIINSGLGIIQPSPIFKGGGASAGMIGEFCCFEGKNLNFMGFNLDGIDLAYLCKVGDEINCNLQMLDQKRGKAQFEIKIGAISRIPQSYNFNDRLPEILPQMSKMYTKLSKMGCDFGYLERILLRRVPAKCLTASDGMAVGIIYHLDSAEHNETVSKGLIKIETGPYKDRIIRFNRNKCNLFGYDLSNADLLYVFRYFDTVYCDVSGINDYPDGEYVSQKVAIHRPTELIPDCDPFKMEMDDRLDFILWLQSHMLTYREFVNVVHGKNTPRYYIPFPRDQLPGKVISFDETRGKLGCTSGTIKLDGGHYLLDNWKDEGVEKGLKDMKNELVTFHRSNFWVYGRKMAKGDLSYVVHPNQRITCEIRPISDEDRIKHPALPKNIKYRATIVWIGPSRPRNDRDDPSRNDGGIFDWLAKRNLTIKNFGQLIEGKLIPHQPHELGPGNFYLPPKPADMLDPELNSGFGGGKPDAMPVLRHGPHVANMLETAIMAGGPEDPRLFTLIQNEQQAQQAHHIAQALQYALKYYKDGLNRGPPPGAPGFGFGFKRPSDVDYNMFGGGYARANKRSNWGGM